MSLANSLRKLIKELDRVHPSGNLDIKALDHEIIPTFRTAENGELRYLTDAAISELVVIVNTHYKNDPNLISQIRVEEFSSIVHQATVDCHAAGFFDLTKHQISDCKNVLRKHVDIAIANLRQEYTHYFPAWTLGAEMSQFFAVGPVIFQTREQWISSVQFPVDAIRIFSPRKGYKYDWKARLRKELIEKDRNPKKHCLHHQVFLAIKDCPSVLKVNVSNSELGLSRQRARFVCRTALDSLSLLFDGNGDICKQFVLHDERLQPVGVSRLMETNGDLWLPGSTSHLRGWLGDSKHVMGIVKRGQPLLDACGKIITALLDHAISSTPRLAQRWATALSIYCDGCREPQDSISVAKLVASLDILSGGGMESGILKMLLHLTNASATDVIVKLPQPLTFEKVIKRVYCHGRSQFLHGKHVDPMTRFVEERNYATVLARLALRETVLRLTKYKGADEDKAFQSL